MTIGDCRWTRGVGAFWDHAANKFGFEAQYRRLESEDFAGQSTEEERQPGAKWNLGESGSRFTPTCAVYQKGRILYDRYAQKSIEVWRTVWDSRRWEIQ